MINPLNIKVYCAIPEHKISHYLTRHISISFDLIWETKISGFFQEKPNFVPHEYVTICLEE